MGLLTITIRMRRVEDAAALVITGIRIQHQQNEFDLRVVYPDAPPNYDPINTNFGNRLRISTVDSRNLAYLQHILILLHAREDSFEVDYRFATISVSFDGRAFVAIAATLMNRAFMQGGMLRGCASIKSRRLAFNFNRIIVHLPIIV
ncbi:hypothetical protein PRIPAC_85329 [Pristionchus pacificus]|uniref:Uncharacterized protein n=1 Tax=Pristionchus pacificus TaxID=54126 RepID=A0A2A6BLD1_PRIPA|nr:hypothetical protein PRIPAC_85329 [Pristionchus pacificus]|eukprot:PDM66732.1 hypothetical protein PRIPAC_48149 [Pristionchus pacificus]